MRSAFRLGASLALALLLTAAAAAPIDLQRQRLAAARQAAALAGARAERLLIAAAAEGDAAARAAAEQQGLAARVTAAEAELAAAEAQAAIVTRLLVARRAALAQEQAPVARLIAALQSLTLRPSAVTIAQPGSVDDLVHLRAVLASVIPAIRTRTAGLRAQVAATRALRERTVTAGQALRTGRKRLDAERQVLVAAETRHRTRATELGRGALSESDRALALGEAARDLLDQMAEEGKGQATIAALARLPGPSPRPAGGDGARMTAPPAALYRLPVQGRLVTGFGEISEAGVRSRGLTIAASAEAPVVAPADGVIRYAGAFRGYGRIVIVDHGGGWTSLVTGMGPLAVVLGQNVRAGDTLGQVGAGEEPRVTVELRRRGRPIDAAALVG
ncbi:murein hydrolase activator EnvC family protein [Sphingomonas sp. 1P08PE]|uniref:murein hydrolase activator EnvC family protein n=1 Tax=Sphingomonas sp. 1P08PE TaxID=554122 RepID=UPI0039A23157